MILVNDWERIRWSTVGHGAKIATECPFVSSWESVRISAWNVSSDWYESDDNFTLVKAIT
jgi:hypothetical protein